MMSWLRWHNGTVSDPKWRAIARDSDQPIHAVLAVWAAMLECASAADQRGRLQGGNDRVAAAAFDISVEAVTAIRAAMQGLTLSGDKVTAWAKRQPNREDNSTARVRQYRQRQKRADQGDPTIATTTMKRGVTQRNAPDSEEIQTRGERAPSRPLRPCSLR